MSLRHWRSPSIQPSFCGFVVSAVLLDCAVDVEHIFHDQVLSPSVVMPGSFRLPSTTWGCAALNSDRIYDDSLVRNLGYGPDV